MTAPEPFPTTGTDVDDGFARRHIGPSNAELAAMLDVIGAGTLEDLLDQTIPSPIRTDDAPLTLPPARTEAEVLAALRELAAENHPRTSLIGMGYAGTRTPGVIQRNVLENPAWYTAYTPYQPEISQGRLEALLNFQTMVSELTGLEVANASLLDEATAAAEAMTMARRLSKASSSRFVVHHDTHPQTIAVLATRAEPIGIELVVGDVDDARRRLLRCAVQPADVHRCDHRLARGDRRACTTAVASPSSPPTCLACTLITPPGELGADIAVGSAQRFGVPMGFGGPHAAFMAAHASAARAMPGRLVGVSTDTEGRPALRLALQTREQHIRREKATSNICTAQVLLANIAGLYACWHGPDGLRAIAERIHGLAAGWPTPSAGPASPSVTPRAFDTITVDDVDAAGVIAAGADLGIDLRRVGAGGGRHEPRRDDHDRHRRAGGQAFGVAARRHRSGAIGADRRSGDDAPHRHVPAARRCSTASTPSTRCCATCAAWPTATSPSTAR